MYTAAQKSPVIESQLSITGELENNSNLIWPRQQLEEINNTDKKDKVDLHLVLEYAEGDSILGGRFTAPRSNRFYFVHDPNGGKMQQLEPYHAIAKASFPQIKRHLFGGYQLL